MPAGLAGILEIRKKNKPVGPPGFDPSAGNADVDDLPYRLIVENQRRGADWRSIPGSGPLSRRARRPLRGLKSLADSSGRCAA
jgi:hypothetical protein